MKWVPIILLVIGVLVTMLAVCGIFAWGVSDKDELVALSVVFVFVGVALFIVGVVWLTKQRSQEKHKK
jgi:hypothetical protein